MIFLRGVGQTVGQPGVATHVDGVYQARNFQTALAQVDLARVEILRGPQGTLYGRNATAGAVNFVTQAPTAEFEGWGMAAYGNYEHARLQGVVNVPISDRLRTRFVVDYADQNEGFIKNVIPGGQIFDPKSPHYSDFFDLWKKNQTTDLAFQPANVVTRAKAELAKNKIGRARFTP